MSGTIEDNEVSDEGRLKKLEAKAEKVEHLLTMNICFSFIGCIIFLFLPIFQFIWPAEENGGDWGFYNFIFIGFLIFYGILNWIILSKESPNQSIKKEEINQKKNSV